MKPAIACGIWVLCLAFVPISTYCFANQDYTVSVTSVSVWVKAVDSSGKAVLSLTTDDFEIYENGHKMTLTCFEELSTPSQTVETAAPVETPSAPMEKPKTGEATHKFVLFLDLYNTTGPDYLSIKTRLKEFFDQLHTQNYEAMIAALTPQGKLGVVSGFTKDTARLKAILDQARGNAVIDQEVRSNEKQIVDLLEQIKGMEPASSDPLDVITGSSPTVELNSKIMRDTTSLARNFAKQEKARGEFSVSALEAFAGYLAKQSEDNHTAIIYVSGGFNVQPGRRYFELIDRFMESKGFKNDSFVYALRSGGTPIPEKFDLYSLLQKTIGKLERFNVTLYTINTRGIAMAVSNTGMSNEFEVPEYKYLPDFQEPLAQIADETGGLFFQNSRNFKLGLDRVLDDLNHQYILCYKPPAPDPAIEYNKIKVVCKKPGVDLRYRKGYQR